MKRPLPKNGYEEHLRSLLAEQEAARKASGDFLADEQLSALHDAIVSRGTQKPERSRRAPEATADLQRAPPATSKSEKPKGPDATMEIERHPIPRGLEDAVKRGEVSAFDAEFIWQNLPLQRELAAKPKPKKRRGPKPYGPMLHAARAALVAAGNEDIFHPKKKVRRDAIRKYLKDHCGVHEEINDTTFQRDDL